MTEGTVAVCGVPASLLALCLLCACVCGDGGCVRTRTRGLHAVRHHVICRGWEPYGSGVLSLCAASLGTGEAAGGEGPARPTLGHMGPCRMACAPSALTSSRRRKDRGPPFPRPSPPQAMALPPPPSPHLKKILWISPVWQPPGGVPRSYLAAETPVSRKRSQEVSPPSH